MTGQILCSDECLWTKDVGQRDLRVALLSIEQEPRVWLSIEGSAIQFERMEKDANGQSRRGLQAVGDTAARWRAIVTTGQTRLTEDVDLVERSQHLAAAGDGYYQLDHDEAEVA